MRKISDDHAAGEERFVFESYFLERIGRDTLTIPLVYFFDFHALGVVNPSEDEAYFVVDESNPPQIILYIALVHTDLNRR